MNLIKGLKSVTFTFDNDSTITVKPPYTSATPCLCTEADAFYFGKAVDAGTEYLVSQGFPLTTVI